MSVRSSTIDLNQFAPVAVPSAPEQDARRRELQQVIKNTINGTDASYEKHIEWLRNTGKERARVDKHYSQALGDVDPRFKIVDLDNHSRLNRVHLVSTLSGNK